MKKRTGFNGGMSGVLKVGNTIVAVNKNQLLLGQAPSALLANMPTIVSHSQMQCG
jgi:hypothetical protein